MLGQLAEQHRNWAVDAECAWFEEHGAAAGFEHDVDLGEAANSTNARPSSLRSSSGASERDPGSPLLGMELGEKTLTTLSTDVASRLRYRRALAHGDSGSNASGVARRRAASPPALGRLHRRPWQPGSGFRASWTASRPNG